MRMTVIAAVLVACGGSGTAPVQAVPSAPGAPAAPDAGAQTPPVSIRAVSENEINGLSGLDCSTAPCPVWPNLQCVSLFSARANANRRECFLVVTAANATPADECPTVRVDRTSTGQSTPIVCAPLCNGSAAPGAQTCPHDLSCIDDGARRYCFE